MIRSGSCIESPVFKLLGHDFNLWFSPRGYASSGTAALADQADYVGVSLCNVGSANVTLTSCVLEVHTTSKGPVGEYAIEKRAWKPQEEVGWHRICTRTAVLDGNDDDTVVVKVEVTQVNVLNAPQPLAKPQSVLDNFGSLLDSGLHRYACMRDARC
jgi:hypothetical protein